MLISDIIERISWGLLQIILRDCEKSKGWWQLGHLCPALDWRYPGGETQPHLVLVQYSKQQELEQKARPYWTAQLIPHQSCSSRKHPERPCCSYPCPTHWVILSINILLTLFAGLMVMRTVKRAQSSSWTGWLSREMPPESRGNPTPSLSCIFWRPMNWRDNSRQLVASTSSQSFWMTPAPRTASASAL